MLFSTIFIADDHPILNKGLISFLTERKYNVIGSEIDGRKALNFIIKNQPDIAILDISMPSLSGIEIAEECKRLKLSTRIILLTYHKEIDFFLEAKKYNIYGYLLKEFALEEIEKCIKSVDENIPFFSKKIRKYFELVDKDRVVLKSLTMSEIRILKLIAEYKTSLEIARMLFLSPRTIEKHRSNIISKLGIDKRNRTLNVWVRDNKHLFIESH